MRPGWVTTWRVRGAGACTLLLLGLAGGASAAPVFPDIPGACYSFNPGGPGTTNTSFSTSCSRTPDTFIDTPVSTRVDTYLTRLIALLDGSPTLHYDQTFAVPFGDPAVVAALLAAQAALQAQSANPLSFLGPTLDSTSTLLVDSTTQTVVIGDPVVTQTFGLGETIGPDTIPIGDLGDECTGLQTADFPFPYVGGFSSVIDYPTGCTGGTPVEIISGTDNFNANVNYQFEFTREIRTIDTYLTEEIYRLVGVVEPDSTVPLPGSLALVGIGAAASVTLRRRRRGRTRSRG